MKKLTTIIFVLLFTSSFAQTTVIKKPVAKPQTTVKPATTTSKPPVKPVSKPATSTVKKPATQVKSTTSRPQTKAATTPSKPTPTVQQQAKPTPPPAPQPIPQPTPTPAPAPHQPAAQQPQPTPQSKSQIESIWISGSVGGGLALSTNIINSGAVFPANLEILFQTRHHRCGIGLANELYITPEALGRLLLGEAPVVKKLYFTYEAFIFRNFPVNLGFSSHIGFFGTSGSHTLSEKSGSVDTATARGGIFGNVGVVLELGARPFYFFVRPAMEYKSWSGFHKEIMATGSIGIRLKFLTDYEIKRRADKKNDRDNKR